MPTYNGHKSRNYWNVALWIGNDEPLYRLALDCIRKSRTKDEAAKRFVELMGGDGAKTPDGAPYTVGAVRAALTDLE